MGRGTVNRLGHTTCAPGDLRVVDYGEDHRWRVRCVRCGHTEHWTQREWRRATRAPVESGLIRVASDDA